jgi:hypothetical protein
MPSGLLLLFGQLLSVSNTMFKEQLNCENKVSVLCLNSSILKVPAGEKLVSNSWRKASAASESDAGNPFMETWIELFLLPILL